jgi:hypothetical protein
MKICLISGGRTILMSSTLLFTVGKFKNSVIKRKVCMKCACSWRCAEMEGNKKTESSQVAV